MYLKEIELNLKLSVPNLKVILRFIKQAESAQFCLALFCFCDSRKRKKSLFIKLWRQEALFQGRRVPSVITKELETYSSFQLTSVPECC